jgi:hypothetical protein
MRANCLPRLLILAILLAAALPAAAATRVDLNQGWLFREDPEGRGEASGWSATPPPATENVSVPHTWNVGRLHDYFGVAWYFLKFERPPLASDARVRLNFGATFYAAKVWLNGELLGTHEGGFTAYAFEVTGKLKDSNIIAVRLDNRPGIATIPGFGAGGEPEAHYDWWTYGGLVRSVWLSVSGPAFVERQFIRSRHSNGWTVDDRLRVQSASAASATLRLTARSADGTVAAREEKRTLLKAGANEILFSLPLEEPKLWSLDHPELYDMSAEILDVKGRPLDVDQSTFGVRRVEIRDRHLYLNGERIRPTGMARHEDSPWEGLAETAGTMRHDYDEMVSLHTKITRPVHYPQNPFILDYADRHGILLIPEIPVWQFSEAQLSDPKVLRLAKQQMREMIEEAGNHPSIFAWSVANESAMATPGGIGYFRAMREFIRAEDPERYVSFAEDKLAKLDSAAQSAANDADFVMMNQYYGSWHGPAEALPGVLDKVDRLFPDKMVIISEMGFAGIFAKNAREADEARIKIFKEQMPLLAARDFIGGAILWCYQDYKSPRNLWPGLTEGFVEHGLVDEWRQRKPSYAVWKDLNQPAALRASWQLNGAAVSGFSLQVVPHDAGALPYYPLHDYRLTWRVLAANGTTLAHGERAFAGVAAGASFDESLPVGAKPNRLRAELISPGGVAAAELDLAAP